jgi:hypothetical protein
MMMSEYGGALSAALIVALCGLISQALWVLVKSHGRASSRRRLTGVRKWKFAVASLKVQKVALDACKSRHCMAVAGDGTHFDDITFL